jgi:hypothetical protein
MDTNKPAITTGMRSWFDPHVHYPYQAPRAWAKLVWVG